MSIPECGLRQKRMHFENRQLIDAYLLVLVKSAEPWIEEVKT